MYSVESGQIIPNVRYKVIGDKNVVYGGNEYRTGEFFRGIDGIKDFIFTGDGTGFLTEISEINSGVILFRQPHSDLSFSPGATVITGTAIQFKLTEADKIVNAATKLLGMSITFKNYPSYVHFVNETRFSFNPD